MADKKGHKRIFKKSEVNMESGYSLDTSCLDYPMTLIIHGKEIPDNQIIIKDEDDLYKLIQALFELYKDRMDEQ